MEAPSCAPTEVALELSSRAYLGTEDPPPRPGSPMVHPPQPADPPTQQRTVASHAAAKALGEVAIACRLQLYEVLEAWWAVCRIFNDLSEESPHFLAIVFGRLDAEESPERVLDTEGAAQKNKISSPCSLGPELASRQL